MVVCGSGTICTETDEVLRELTGTRAVPFSEDSSWDFLTKGCGTAQNGKGEV